MKFIFCGKEKSKKSGGEYSPWNEGPEITPFSKTAAPFYLSPVSPATVFPFLHDLGQFQLSKWDFLLTCFPDDITGFSWFVLWTLQSLHLSSNFVQTIRISQYWAMKMALKTPIQYKILPQLNPQISFPYRYPF